MIDFVHNFRVCLLTKNEEKIMSQKMRNVLKRMKNLFSNFFDHNFLSYDRFCSQFSSVLTEQKWKKKKSQEWVLNTHSPAHNEKKNEVLVFESNLLFSCFFLIF